MAKKPNPTPEKAEVMIAEPGHKFIAKKDCFIGKCFKEGETVEFAPGQEVPLNLVRLVVPEFQEEDASTDAAAGQQEGANSQDSMQGGDSGDDSAEGSAALSSDEASAAANMSGTFTA